MKLFFLVFLLIAEISYCQWEPKLTLSNPGYQNLYTGAVPDLSTGKMEYFQYTDSSNSKLYELVNYSLAFSIPFATAGYYHVICKFDRNGAKAAVIEGAHPQSGNNGMFLIIMDLVTNTIIKQWIDPSLSYEIKDYIISPSNRILLIINTNFGQYGYQNNSLSIYDIGAASPTVMMDKPQDVNSFSLRQNYPNPFNPETTIEYSVSKPGISKINIYDITGKLVNTIEQNNMQSGTYRYHWNGLNSSGAKLASGRYIYELEADGYQQAKKMMMLK